MGRKRKPITLSHVKQKGAKAFVYIKHPVFGKTVCFSLGKPADVPKSLEALNRIFLNESLWHNPPADDMPSRIYEQWLGPDNVLKLHGSGTVQRGETPLDSSPEEVATLLAEIAQITLQMNIYKDRCEQQGRELESLRGTTYRKTASPSLTDAMQLVLKMITGRHPGHVRHVSLCLKRFINDFGPHTKCSELQGRESEISAWIASLKKRDGKQLGPNARQYYRIYILKILRAGGAKFDAKAIQNISRKEMKKSRGEIRWLTAEQAQAVLDRLPQPYADAFLLQCRVGLRPYELLTIHRDNFNADHSELMLAPLGNLSLKTGSRKIPIPGDLRQMIRDRFAVCPILLHEPAGRRFSGKSRSVDESKRKRKRRLPPAEGMRPWRNPDIFAHGFKKALTRAATEANVSVRMDCRIGRRTCASLLLQANVTADRIAALLGNSAEQILSAYGNPDTRNLSLTATALRIK